MHNHELENLNQMQQAGRNIFIFAFGMTFALILSTALYLIQKPDPPDPGSLWHPKYPTEIAVTIDHANEWTCLYGEKNKDGDNWADCRSGNVILIGENIRGDRLPRLTP